MKQHTNARILQERSGHQPKTSEILAFQEAHAKARDAVLQEWDITKTAAQLKKNKIRTLILSTAITTRQDYLKSPHLGRQLSTESMALLKSKARTLGEVIWIVSDGLSSFAIQNHIVGFLKCLKKNKSGFFNGTVLLCPYSRVAISDAIGEIVKPQASIVLIGERPGLSSPDSMGLYLTYKPRKAKQDSDRNCISNIRPPEGLSYAEAFTKLDFLLKESLRLKLSGVNLKDDSKALALETVGSHIQPV